MLYQKENMLMREYCGERVAVEPYGKNSLRVRITKNHAFIRENWALIPQKEQSCEIKIGCANGLSRKFPGKHSENTASILNGKIMAVITSDGKLSFKRADGKVLLEEYLADTKNCLGIKSRELNCVSGDVFKAVMRFNANPEEKLYGMGQYPNGIFNLKGSVLELVQRNTQSSVPFLYSSLNYGFLWNNPAIGKVCFGTNMTEWEAESTKQIEFWITCGDNSAEILENYVHVTGRPPEMPEYGLGLWQCKLRYYNQKQVMNVAREYTRRGIPLDVIVIDFFHWPKEGDWCFDRKFWPNPGHMVKKLKKMGIKVMVSVWPTVAVNAKNYEKMNENGYLIQTEAGVNIHMKMIDDTSFVDVTNPKARAYFWSRIKENYCKYGIYDFWLDVAEPEFTDYSFENYHYHKGNALMVANEYPAMYSKTFYDGLRSIGQKDVISLVRSAWAGSQKYGALVWSGDVQSTFQSFKTQIICGMHMAMAGIPWWCTDIGGFSNGNIHDEKFQELLIRWFQFGAFSPVMRMHGDRDPHKPVIGSKCGTGASNEIWSYGKENYEIMKKYIFIREKLKPYIRKMMKICSEKGTPVIRPLFFHFQKDSAVWEIDDEYLFGSDLLIAPVTEYGARERDVYLPSGVMWVNAYTGELYDGGQTLSVPAELDTIPVFFRADSKEIDEDFFRI